MVRTCAVAHCRSRGSKYMYRIPLEPALRAIWLQRIRRRHFHTLTPKQLSNKRVCVDHFEPHCLAELSQRNTLKYNALPTKLLPVNYEPNYDNCYHNWDDLNKQETIIPLCNYPPDELWVRRVRSDCKNIELKLKLRESKESDNIPKERVLPKAADNILQKLLQKPIILKDKPEKTIPILVDLSDESTCEAVENDMNDNNNESNHVPTDNNNESNHVPTDNNNESNHVPTDKAHKKIPELLVVVIPTNNKDQYKLEFHTPIVLKDNAAGILRDPLSDHQLGIHEPVLTKDNIDGDNIQLQKPVIRKVNKPEKTVKLKKRTSLSEGSDKVKSLKVRTKTRKLRTTNVCQKCLKPVKRRGFTCKYCNTGFHLRCVKFFKDVTIIDKRFVNCCTKLDDTSLNIGNKGALENRLIEPNKDNLKLCKKCLQTVKRRGLTCKHCNAGFHARCLSSLINVTVIDNKFVNCCKPLDPLMEALAHVANLTEMLKQRDLRITKLEEHLQLKTDDVGDLLKVKADNAVFRSQKSTSICNTENKTISPEVVPAPKLQSTNKDMQITRSEPIVSVKINRNKNKNNKPMVNKEVSSSHVNLMNVMSEKVPGKLTDSNVSIDDSPILIITNEHNYCNFVCDGRFLMAPDYVEIKS